MDKIVTKEVFMSQGRSTFTIAQEVLALIKSQTVCSNDIIPLTKLPYFSDDKMEDYKKQYGQETITRFREQLVKNNKIRAKAQELLPLFETKSIPSPFTTMQVAITLCGAGECGEITNRALVELIKAGCKKPIRMVATLGKARKPSHRAAGNYEDHAFLIIGETPIGWDNSTALSSFGKLSDDCILLDPSLGIIGKAKETEVLLKGVFAAYEINRIEPEAMLFVDPMAYDISHNETILKNAKEWSDMINRSLDLTREAKSTAATEKKEHDIAIPADDKTYVHIDYPATSDAYVLRLQSAVGDYQEKKLICRDSSGTRVSLPIFWLKQLKAPAIEELSKELGKKVTF